MLALLCENAKGWIQGDPIAMFGTRMTTHPKGEC